MSDGDSDESSYVSPCWEKDGTFHMVCIVVISVGVVVAVVTFLCTRQGGYIFRAAMSFHNDALNSWLILLKICCQICTKHNYLRNSED